MARLIRPRKQNWLLKNRQPKYILVLHLIRRMLHNLTAEAHSLDSLTEVVFFLSFSFFLFFKNVKLAFVQPMLKSDLTNKLKNYLWITYYLLMNFYNYSTSLHLKLSKCLQQWKSSALDWKHALNFIRCTFDAFRWCSF